MERVEHFNAVVNAAYAAALDPALWPKALETLSDAVGAEGATIEIINSQRGAHEFVQFGRLPEDRQDDYRQHYFHICPRIAPVARSRAHDIVADYDFISEADMNRDPFYSEFLAPYDMRYFLSATVIQNGRWSAHLSPQFSTRHGHAQASEIAFLRAVTPHFERALDVFLALEAQRSRAEGAERLMSDASAGIILIDRDLGVKWLNPAAERILGKNGAVVSISRRRLYIRDEPSQNALKAMIAEADQPITTVGQGVMHHKKFIARNGRPPLMVILLPLAVECRYQQMGTHRAFAVIIEDPTEPLPLSPDSLIGSFGLTPAEAAVAVALADALSPAEIAARRGIGMATVRTHIARVLEKTGSRSIVELVRLLALAAAWK